MNPRSPPLLRRIAHETAQVVLTESTRHAIEKMATEFAREMLDDHEFRRELRDEARRAAREIAASLRATRPAP